MADEKTVVVCSYSSFQGTPYCFVLHKSHLHLISTSNYGPMDTALVYRFMVKILLACQSKKNGIFFSLAGVKC